MKKILFYLGLFLIVIGLVWEVKVYADNFDTMFTPRLSFQLFWKPLVCLITGYIMMKIADYLKK